MMVKKNKFLFIFIYFYKAKKIIFKNIIFFGDHSVDYYKKINVDFIKKYG